MTSYCVLSDKKQEYSGPCKTSKIFAKIVGVCKQMADPTNTVRSGYFQRIKAKVRMKKLKPSPPGHRT